MIDRKILLGQKARLIDRSQAGDSDKGVTDHLVLLYGNIADCYQQSGYRAVVIVVISGSKPGTVSIDDNGINVFNTNQLLQIEVDTDVPGAISWESADKFAAQVAAQTS